MKTAFWAALLTAGLARGVAAGSPLADAKNQTVHLWAPERVEGRLVDFDAQTVTVKPAVGDSRVFERSAIQKMEVSRGKSFHVGMTLAGAGAGALTGLAIAYAACDSSYSSGNTDACADATWGDVGRIALGGAALGALAAGLATKNAGWVDVADFRPAKVSARVVPQRRGVGVLVAVRF
jgi:hypothetical protein